MPEVRRAARSACARAASASGYRPPMRTFSRPEVIQLNRSPARWASSSRLAMMDERRPGDEQRSARGEPLQLERGHRPAGGAVQDHVPARAQRRQAGVEGRLPDAVEDSRRAGSPGYLADHRAEVRVAGHPHRARPGGQLRLGVGGGRRDDAAAAHDDHLGEQQAYPARRGVHHYLLARRHRVGAAAEVVGGQALQHDRGRGLQVHSAGTRTARSAGMTASSA